MENTHLLERRIMRFRHRLKKMRIAYQYICTTQQLLRGQNMILKRVTVACLKLSTSLPASVMTENVSDFRRESEASLVVLMHEVAVRLSSKVKIALYYGV